MAKLIRYTHFKLDIRLVEQEIFPAVRHNAEEAAQALGISKDQLITECFNQSFGVYIKKGNFKVHRSFHSPITREDINQNDEPTYIYSYKGHLRLKKTSEFYSSDSTLEKIYQGGNIEVPSGQNYLNIPLQNSLAERTQGIWLLLELRGKQKISIDDLIFMKDEIDDYIQKRDMLNNKATDCTANDNSFLELKKVEALSKDNIHESQNEEQRLTRSAIKNNYTKIQSGAWEKIFEREKLNGFIAAKVCEGRPYRYSQRKVEMWLMEDGRYTKKELENL